MRDLVPAEVWAYFEEILLIPRLSKHEEKIINYLESFAKKFNLEFNKDKTGNLIIRKPATPGFENRQTIVLQSHMDMVGEKLLEVEHDFSKDPIKAVEKNGWIYASGTTLGADDGIGVAASMALLASDTIEHGPLECLFTVDEETGMTGAFGIEKGFMKGRILLNLDSEDEGELFIGCAGGIDTVGTLNIKSKLVKEGDTARKIVVEGLQGGHSGDEIHKGFGNSIKMLNLVLWTLERNHGIKISAFTGGKLRNAIPREAEAVIVFPVDQSGDVQGTFDKLVSEIVAEYKAIEPSLRIHMSETALPDTTYRKKFQKRLLNMLYAFPHGVIRWSKEIEGLVETSTNLAVMRNKEAGKLEIVTSQRSSSEFGKRSIANRIESLFLLANADVAHSDGYPGWNPNTNSEILKISRKLYNDLFDEEPKVKAIHAGLECGLFLEKYPDLDMISFGPTIKGAHTPEERLEIASVTKFWDFLLALLKNAPVK